MNFSIHLAPNVPWILFALLTLVIAALGVWVYRFAVPPLPRLAKRLLPALRILALAALLWLLAQPIAERPLAAGHRLLVLLDRSRSMALPVAPGGESRAAAADRAADQVRRAWSGDAVVVPFASRVPPDTVRAGAAAEAGLGTGATALGDAIAHVGGRGDAEAIGAVVVVSDGVVTRGADPVDAARALGLPVHTVAVGASDHADRSIVGIEASSDARVGRPTPVRVRVTTSEPRGTTFAVRLLDEGREVGRATVTSPGTGAEALAEFRVTPGRPGLALYTAEADSLPGELTGVNNARQVAVEVAPGKLEVRMITGALNWDFAFVRRALAADSGLALTSYVRGRDGWNVLELRGGAAPGPDALRGAAVVVLDGIAGREISPAFDEALRRFVSAGGALIAFGGATPGVSRFRSGAFANDLRFDLGAGSVVPQATPEPRPEARELLQWDDDPARGERAWRSSAPLADLAPIEPGAGDRVLVGSAGAGPPLLLVRRIGRGQVLLVNGTGVWRWSLSGTDELSAERGRRLWRGLVRALSEPVQGEPLRVRPERWLTPHGEALRLFATLQDPSFRPVSGANVTGELRDARGRSRPVTFEARGPGSYVATLEDLEPGRYQASARATVGGREAGRASAPFAIDRWSFEVARTTPDSATLAAVARAAGGATGDAASVPRWARGLQSRALARARTETVRLWESPWTFAIVIAALSVEWAWRRRRGLP